MWDREIHTLNFVFMCYSELDGVRASARYTTGIEEKYMDAETRGNSKGFLQLFCGKLMFFFSSHVLVNCVKCENV